MKRPSSFNLILIKINSLNIVSPPDPPLSSQALQRDVTLIVEGVDKYNNLFASLLLPPINSSGRENLGELLVQEGLAKVMEFSVSMLSSGAQKMRDLERAAKLSKLRIWTNYVPTQSNQAKLTDAFLGKVIEVVSGDCIVVKEEGSGGKERRLQLSSLRAPRTATRDRAAEPWANDAKDFLRKKIVGRQVEVKMEYVRKVPALDGTGAGAAGGGAGERELLFANIELLGEGKGEEKANVGEMVAARGFATVLKHKSDEERSRVYDKLLECEELAKQVRLTECITAPHSFHACYDCPSDL